MARSASKPRHTAQQTWEPTDWQCIGLLGILVGIFFAPFLVGRAFLWEDFVYQWYPFRQFAASTLARGELPLWNPYTFNGMPFLAEIQTEVFYLPMTLLTLFVRDGHLDVFWLQMVNILHYWLAGAGMFFLSRSYQLRRIPSLFAGIAYAFSGFLVLHAIHQVILVVVAWFPLILWMVRRAIASPRWYWVFATGVVLGHSFFGGSPQMSLFFYFFLLCYVLFEILSGYGFRGVFSRPALRVAARSAAIVAISMGIALVQFLPTQELSSLSQRAQITFEKAAEGGLAWQQVLTLLSPKLFGFANVHGSEYWGPGAYWYYWETCIYIGLLPLLLALLAIWTLKGNRAVLFFGGVALFALLFSLGANFFVHPAFFHYVPGFAAFRNPARMGIFIALAASLLSAFALHHLGERNAARSTTMNRRPLFIISAVAAVILLLILAGALDGLLGVPPDMHARAQLQRAAGASIVMLFVAAGTIWLMISRKGAPHWLGLLACAFLFVDAYLFSADHNTSPDNPADHFRRAERITSFIKQQQGIFRVNIRNPHGLMMDRNQGMVDRIYTMEGYTPLVLQRVHPPTDNPETMFDLLNVRFITVTDTIKRQLMMQERPRVLSRAHMVYDVRPTHSETELVAALKDPGFDPSTIALIEEDLPRSIAAPDSLRPAWNTAITAMHDNSIQLTVTTERDGFLVLSETFYPGWNAYVDGNPTRVYRTDFSLRGIVVPAGEHSVVFRFESASFKCGLWVSLATLALCIAGWSVSWQRSRSSTNQPAVQ